MSARKHALAKALERRAPLAAEKGLSAFRLVNAAGDGLPDFTADRLGDVLYLQAEEESAWRELLPQLLRVHAWQGVCVKAWRKSVRGRSHEELKPEVLEGSVPESFTIQENGLSYELRPFEGYSYGIFLDQRAQRARILSQLRPGERLLNTFAYTCAFSVAAAKAGAHVTSVDLSKKYLEWGRRNFALNRLDPEAHAFFFGDVREWLKRLRRKEERFDWIVLDPPTFGSSKTHGVFKVEDDYPDLLAGALALAAPGARLLCSQNKREWTPPRFAGALESSLRGGSNARVTAGAAPSDFPGDWEQNPSARVVWIEL